MHDKQVYDLAPSDLARFSAWYFPMDDSVEDELTVRPCVEGASFDDLQVVLRACFKGGDGSTYTGYLYWDVSGAVEYLKPVVFLEEGVAISFWSGIVKPSWDEYPEHARRLRYALPVSYKSVNAFGFGSLVGKLEGLGYLDGDKVCWVK